MKYFCAMERNHYAELCGGVLLHLLPVSHIRKLHPGQNLGIQHPPVLAKRLQREHREVGAGYTHELAVNSED